MQVMKASKYGTSQISLLTAACNGICLYVMGAMFMKLDLPITATLVYMNGTCWMALVGMVLHDRDGLG